MKIDQETGEIYEPIEIQPPFLRTPYNYDRDRASINAGLVCPEPTKAQQQFKEDSDINTIVERFGLTGEMPAAVRVPLNEEFIEATDYHTALTRIKEAQAGFMELPANIRSEFKNDPGEFIAFMENPDNRKRAEDLGIVIKKEPAPPPAAPPATPPAAGGGVS